jgi:hypothetical protein
MEDVIDVDNACQALTHVRSVKGYLKTKQLMARRILEILQTFSCQTPDVTCMLKMVWLKKIVYDRTRQAFGPHAVV